ncbi:unnamed protein product [Ectocarpus sp. 12 AP-2014]
MVRSRPPSWRDSSRGSAASSVASSNQHFGSQHVGKQADPALTLDRVIGQTCLHNSALAVNPITGDVAYPAGCVVVIYQPRRNRQFRYFRASKTVSCLAFSRDGGMLVVGERGHQPSATVWNLATGAVVRELAGGHRFGIGCISFTPSGGGVVTMGFKHDRMLRVWDLQLAMGRTGDLSPDLSPDRSAFPVPVYPSSDPESPPPPPPPPSHPSNDRWDPGDSYSTTAAVTPKRQDEAREVASARVPQRVRAMSFTSDGECLVTCGDSHVKFWKMPENEGTSGAINGGGFVGIGADASLSGATRTPRGGESSRGESGGLGVAGGGEVSPVVGVLEGWAATIGEELKGATFVDVCSSGKRSGGGRGGGHGGAGAADLDSVFCVTAEGVLCAFTRGGVMEHWVSLEAPAAYGLSVHEDGTLAVACADGVVRLFKADSLGYVATLPRPPPLGHANIASVRELQEIADLSAAAAKAGAASGTGAAGGDGVGASPRAVAESSFASGFRGTADAAPEENDSVNVGTIDKDAFGKVKSGNGDASSGHRSVVRYPAALGCRLTPSGTKVVCIYADRGLFIWDITDPLCVGKYRSFLAHGGCIWDVQRMPAKIPTLPGAGSQSPPDIPAGAMVTCSADNTVRLWDLGALDGKGTGDNENRHSGRWSNIYSKHLLRVLYASEENTGDSNGNANPGKNEGQGKRAPNEDFGKKAGRVFNYFGDDAAAKEVALSEGALDPEIPHKPEWSCSPRSLAVHPDGSQVACGDKGGRICVYDLEEMELAHMQSAHGAEVLCLAYSPLMVPAPCGGRSSSTSPTPPSPTDTGGVSSDNRERAARDGGDAGGAKSLSSTGTVLGATPPPSSISSRILAARGVGAWDAVDPLDPDGATKKMLALSLMSSSLPPPSEVTATAVMSGPGRNAGGREGDAGISHDDVIGRERDEGCPERKECRGNEGGEGEGGEGEDARSNDACAPRQQSQTDDSTRRSPLVLLASASRDRLVRVFDASRSPFAYSAGAGVGGRGAGGGSGASEAATMAAQGSAAACAENDVAHRSSRGKEDGQLGARENATNTDATAAPGRAAETGVGAASEAAGLPLLTTLDSHTGSVSAVKFSKDGKRLITAGGDQMLVLNSVRGPHVHRLRAVKVPQGTIYGLDVDPTNKYIVTAGQDKRLNIWSTISGKHVRAYKVEPSMKTPNPSPSAESTAGGQGGTSVGERPRDKGDTGGELFKVDLDPTGMYAAACSFDKWIRLFDFYSGECLAKVAGHSELATGVRFTPDGRRLVTTGGDGVMFVWRLSPELHQSMRDRMCELRPGGETTGGSSIRGTRDGGRGGSTLSSDTPKPTSAAATAATAAIPPPTPLVPPPSEASNPAARDTAETGVPTTVTSGDQGLSAADDAGDNGSDSGDGTRDSGLQAGAAKSGVVDARMKTMSVTDGAADKEGSSGDGEQGPGWQVTPAKSGVEARAKAKADAKARLRFQRYQLPAWAHTQQGLAPTATPATTNTPPSSSMPVKDSLAEKKPAAEGAETTPGTGCSGGSDGGRGEDGLGNVGGDGSGDAAAKVDGDVVEAEVGDEVDLGRDSPPPMLAALVPNLPIGGGSFSQDRRGSKESSRSFSDGPDDGKYGSSSGAITETRTASKTAEKKSGSTSNTGAEVSSPGSSSGVTSGGSSSPSLYQNPPTSAQQKEAATVQGNQRLQKVTSPEPEVMAAIPADDILAVIPTTAATTTARLREDRDAAAKGSGGGRAPEISRARWGIRREGVAAAAASAKTATLSARGSKSDVLAAARGRWERRGVQEEGSLEIVGHGAGTKSSFQKNFNQPSASVKRVEEAQQASVADPDGGTSVGKAPASLAEFREDEDGVIMGDPDDDEIDEHEYSMDDDFEEAGLDRAGAIDTPKIDEPGPPRFVAGGRGGDLRRSEDKREDDTPSPSDQKGQALLPSDAAPVAVSGGSDNSSPPHDAEKDQEMFVPEAREAAKMLLDDVERDGLKETGGRRHDGSGACGDGDDATAANVDVTGVKRMTSSAAVARPVPPSATSTTAAAAAANDDDDDDVSPKTYEGVKHGRNSCIDDSNPGSMEGISSLRRGKSFRSKANAEGVAVAASLEGGGRPGPATSTASSESSERTAANQREEGASSKRDRRISETEGAVETMRRKLSAMGFLEAGGDSPSCEDEGAAAAKRVGEETRFSPINALSEAPRQSAEGRGSPPVSGKGATTDAALTADAETEERERTDNAGAEGEGEDRRIAAEPAASSPRPPPLPSRPPPPLSSSPCLECHSVGPDADGLRTDEVPVGTLSDSLTVDVQSAHDDGVEASSSGLGVAPSSNRGTNAGHQHPLESGSSSFLSFGRRRRRRYHRSRQEENNEDRGSVSPFIASNGAAVALPRPDKEYEEALLRLTEAASHAAELYRELKEASSASFASLETGTETRTGTEEEGSGLGLESFPSMSSVGLGRGSPRLDSAVCKLTHAGGEHEERRQGNGDSGSGHVAALTSSPSVAPSTSMSHPGESDGDDESYGDDDEWEDEEEVPDEDDPHATAEHKTGQGRGGDRNRLGPLALERSFRESFASVNGILSVMAGKAIPAASSASPSLASIGRSCANNSSCSGAVPGDASNTGSTTSGRLAALSKRKIGTQSSSSHQSAERDRGAQASPPGLSLSFLPPPPRRAQARETASPGGSEMIVGGLRAVISGITAEKAEALPVAEAGDKGAGSVESRSGRAFGSAEEQLPAEMTGMLHRYSEMMLKVVQEKMEARMNDSTLHPST